MSIARIRSLACAAIIALWCYACGKEHQNVAAVRQTSRFVPGQVWDFHTPTNQPTNATLTIAMVDHDPDIGPIIYVSFTGLKRTRWESTNYFSIFSEDALGRSVVTLKTSNDFLTGQRLSDFQTFYTLLHQNIDSGKANKCFEITVEEMLEARGKTDH
jgi:hypothetical protein